MDRIDELEENIRSLAIQGATNVALATLECIEIAAKSLKDARDVYLKLKNIAEKLAYARPMESLAQNGVRFIFEKKGKSIEYYLRKTNEYKLLIRKAKQKIATKGADIIRNGGVYLTHCHSSTVVAMFIEAKKQGKKFSVYTTETRPLYQGHITAKELLKNGIIDVTFIIDNAVFSVIEGSDRVIDAVFIGADLLSQKGFVNKIGTLGIARATQREKVPFYCMSILLKYDKRPYSNSLIETRDGSEIWLDAPRKLKFYTPAFGFVPYDTGVKVICEDGIVEGKKLAHRAISLYTFLR